MLDVVSAPVKQTECWHQVTQQKEGDAAHNHRVKGGGRSQVQASQNGHPERRKQVCVQGNSQVGVNDRQILGEGQAVVSAERPAQSGLPSVRRNGASNTGEQHQRTQAKGADLVLKCLVKNVKNGQAGTVVDDQVQVGDAEEHGDGVGQGGNQPNGDRSQDSNGNDSVGLVDLLGQVRGRVETGETPVGVDQPDNERNSGRLPSGVVLEVHENEVGRVVVVSSAHQDGDENDRVREQRGVQGAVGDHGQVLSVAVEYDKESVDELVHHEELPGLGVVRWVGQLPKGQNGLCKRQSHGGTGENGPDPSQGPTQVSQERRVLSWGQHSRPHVLATSGRDGGGELGEGDTNAVGDECNDDDTVHNQQRTTGLDTGDKRRRNTVPRVGEAETDSQYGPNGESSLQVSHNGASGGGQVKSLLGVGGRLAEEGVMLLLCIHCVAYGSRECLDVSSFFRMRSDMRWEFSTIYTWGTPCPAHRGTSENVIV